MECRFCRKTENHFCSKKFIFKNILRNLLMGILLDYKPTSEFEFFQITMRIIEQENLFEDSTDLINVVLENLKFFTTKYDCF